MSIINRMLQDLDRRQGASDPAATLAMSQVRSVPPARKDREWFWRIIAMLMIAAVGWVAWIAWQLQPREPVATPAAFKAGEGAQRQPAPARVAPVEPKPVEQKLAEAKAIESKALEQKPATAAPAAPKPAATPPAPPKPAETLKLAPAIETPIPAERTAKPAPKAPAQAWKQEPPKAAAAAPPDAAAKPAPQAATEKPAPAPVAQAPPRVDKRERTRSPEDRAEAEFRRGAGLLNQGRTGEAEDGFAAALAAHPGHEAARQALVALHLEQRRIDDARRLLQEGVALNPANARFVTVLARVLIERKDYAGAIEVIDGARAPRGDPELELMRGTALQRLGRHAEASEAFQMSVRGGPQSGAAWMALGISLEAQGKRTEAAEAFKRAAATGSLSIEARDYSEQKARELQ